MENVQPHKDRTLHSHKLRTATKTYTANEIFQHLKVRHVTTGSTLALGLHRKRHIFLPPTLTHHVDSCCQTTRVECLQRYAPFL